MPFLGAMNVSAKLLLKYFPFAQDLRHSKCTGMRDDHICKHETTSWGKVTQHTRLPHSQEKVVRLQLWQL
jgi:hypothetical protein